MVVLVVVVAMGRRGAGPIAKDFCPYYGLGKTTVAGQTQPLPLDLTPWTRLG